MSASANLKIKVNNAESVTAMLYPAAKSDRAGMTITLGHGAGANQLSGFMRMFAGGLAARGLDAMTFNFLYTERGRRIPDPKAKLESCYRAVIEAAQKHKKLKGNRLVIGGKSMGGRIASQVAANPEASENIAALVFLGYPLHPPGRPDKLRDALLPQITAPMLFIQGSRDSFGTTDELRVMIKRLHLPATLYPIEGCDHSLKVPKRGNSPQEQGYETTM